MSYETSVRLELDMSAVKMMQQVKIYNQELEAKISTLIEKAMSEVVDGEYLEKVVGKIIRDEIEKTVKLAINDYSLRQYIVDGIRDNIEKAVFEKVKNVTDNILK